MNILSLYFVDSLRVLRHVTPPPISAQQVGPFLSFSLSKKQVPYAVQATSNFEISILTPPRQLISSLNSYKVTSPSHLMDTPNGRRLLAEPPIEAAFLKVGYRIKMPTATLAFDERRMGGIHTKSIFESTWLKCRPPIPYKSAPLVAVDTLIGDCVMDVDENPKGVDSGELWGRHSCPNGRKRKRSHEPVHHMGQMVSSAKDMLRSDPSLPVDENSQHLTALDKEKTEELKQLKATHEKLKAILDERKEMTEKTELMRKEAKSLKSEHYLAVEIGGLKNTKREFLEKLKANILASTEWCIFQKASSSLAVVGKLKKTLTEDVMG